MVSAVFEDHSDKTDIEPTVGKQQEIMGADNQIGR